MLLTGRLDELPVVVSALPVQILNPPCRLGVADFTEITLGGREIGMPENHFAHNLNRDSGSGGICCGVSSEIMWSEFDSGQLARLFHNKSCRCIRDREYSVAGFDTFVPDVFVEPVSDPSRDEHYFSLFSTFWIPQDQLLIDNIFRGELQDLSDSHPPSGHEFQDKAVSRFDRPEDDLVNGLLFYNSPMVRLSRSIQFPEHRRITGVLESRIEVYFDELKEGFQVRVTSVLGLLFSPFGDFVQKRQDLF